MNAILGLSLAVFIMILMGGMAINLFSGLNTSTWQTGIGRIWNYLPQVFLMGGVIALLLIAIGKATGKTT